MRKVKTLQKIINAGKFSYFFSQTKIMPLTIYIKQLTLVLTHTRYDLHTNCFEWKKAIS